MTPTSFLIYGKLGLFTFSCTPFSTAQQVVSRATRRCIVPGPPSSNSSTENSLEQAQPQFAFVAAGFRRAASEFAPVPPDFSPAAFDFDSEDSAWPQL
jgi:hypothetical protein